MLCGRGTRSSGDSYGSSGDSRSGFVATLFRRSTCTRTCTCTRTRSCRFCPLCSLCSLLYS